MQDFDARGPPAGGDVRTDEIEPTRIRAPVASVIGATFAPAA
jgi:hypothetical protein